MADPINPLNDVTVVVPPTVSNLKPSGNTVDKDTFLKLLVAQLKYQDPSKPADPSQFISQTAQFSEVEKLTDLSTQLTALVGAQQATGATSMIGRRITAAGSDGKDVTGIVSGMKITTAGPVLKVGNSELDYASVKEVDTPIA
jgi:flagellar basal-body rod modification protein FlgD